MAVWLGSPVPVTAADTYRIDPSHTYPSFEISHMGFSIQRGFFEKTQGTITLDWQAKTGLLDIEIDAASIQTGDAKRDEVVRGDGFLAVQHHPKLIYTASEIVFDGDKPARIKGQLQLRGVKRPVELTVTHFECGFNLLKLANGCGADAVAAIQRSDFGIVSFLPSIGDQVWLRIQVEAYK
ncbi:MAG: YceI family protein [Thiobacillus sp.]